MGESLSNRQLYEMARDQILSVVAPLDDATLDQTCEACPDWSIRDVVAHHIHFQRAYACGELPGSMRTALSAEGSEADDAAQERDAWTQVGVEDRRAKPFAEVLAEWEALVDDLTESTAVAIDATMHLFDIRETLRDESGRDLPIVFDAVARYFHLSLGPKLERHGLSVGVTATDTGESIEAPDGAPIIRGSAYDLLRTIGGRRTRTEADAVLDWGQTPEVVRDMWSAYGWPKGSDGPSGSALRADLAGRLEMAADALGGADPESVRSTIRVTNTLDGAHRVTSVVGGHEVVTDQSERLGGTDSGPGPVGLALAALGLVRSAPIGSGL